MSPRRCRRARLLSGCPRGDFAERTAFGFPPASRSERDPGRLPADIVLRRTSSHLVFRRDAMCCVRDPRASLSRSREPSTHRSRGCPRVRLCLRRIRSAVARETNRASTCSLRLPAKSPLESKPPGGCPPFGREPDRCGRPPRSTRARSFLPARSTPSDRGFPRRARSTRSPCSRLREESPFGTCDRLATLAPSSIIHAAVARAFGLSRDKSSVRLPERRSASRARPRRGFPLCARAPSQRLEYSVAQIFEARLATNFPNGHPPGKSAVMVATNFSAATIPNQFRGRVSSSAEPIPELLGRIGFCSTDSITRAIGPLEHFPDSVRCPAEPSPSRNSVARALHRFEIDPRSTCARFRARASSRIIRLDPLPVAEQQIDLDTSSERAAQSPARSVASVTETRSSLAVFHARSPPFPAARPRPIDARRFAPNFCVRALAQLPARNLARIRCVRTSENAIGVRFPAGLSASLRDRFPDRFAMQPLLARCKLPCIIARTPPARPKPGRRHLRNAKFPARIAETRSLETRLPALCFEQPSSSHANRVRSRTPSSVRFLPRSVSPACRRTFTEAVAHSGASFEQRSPAASPSPRFPAASRSIHPAARWLPTLRSNGAMQTRALLAFVFRAVSQRAESLRLPAKIDAAPPLGYPAERPQRFSKPVSRLRISSRAAQRSFSGRSLIRIEVRTFPRPVSRTPSSPGSIERSPVRSIRGRFHSRPKPTSRTSSPEGLRPTRPVTRPPTAKADSPLGHPSQSQRSSESTNGVELQNPVTQASKPAVRSRIRRPGNLSAVAREKIPEENSEIRKQTPQPSNPVTWAVQSEIVPSPTKSIRPGKIFSEPITRLQIYPGTRSPVTQPSHPATHLPKGR